MNENCHFFWSGSFGQWKTSPFVADGVKYNCSEQYMMHQKALLFNDIEIADQIMRTTNPKSQKALGRKVKNFDEKIWEKNMIKIVYLGNFYKFTQNKELFEELMSTGDKLLVEASPYDRIWGIGMNADKARVTKPEHWNGRNLLGKILTLLRDELRKQNIKPC